MTYDEVLLDSINRILLQLVEAKKQKNWDLIADALNRLYGTRDNLEATIEENK